MFGIEVLECECLHVMVFVCGRVWLWVNGVCGYMFTGGSSGANVLLMGRWYAVLHTALTCIECEHK